MIKTKYPLKEERLI